MGFVKHLFISVLTLLIRYPYIRWRSRKKMKTTVSTDEILNVLRKGPVMHRGGIPENTVKAFHISKSMGASSVEVDLQFTKDGHPILLHDDTVDRTSNGSGAISDMTLEEVKLLDFGTKYGYDGVSIPSLYEAIEALKQLEMYLFLEVKSLNKNTLNLILELFKNDQTLYDRIVVISFFPNILHAITQVDPRIKVGYVTRSTMFSRDANGNYRFHNRWITKLIEILEQFFYWLIKHYIFTVLHLSVMLPHKDDVLKKRFELEKHRSSGVVVLTWTVNDDREKQHMSDVLRIPFMTDNRQ